MPDGSGGQSFEGKRNIMEHGTETRAHLLAAMNALHAAYKSALADHAEDTQRIYEAYAEIVKIDHARFCMDLKVEYIANTDVCIFR